MRYGLPYKGSKNAIAEWVIENLPRADVFCDIFFGGGAITHCAMMTNKYKRFIINDIDARLPKLFVDCAYGKYTVENHPEWISREEFNAKKADNAYIALCWSFGNNGKDYLYGADIEEHKHAFHVACFENDISLMLKCGIKVHKSDKDDVYARYLDYSKQIKNFKHNALENLTRLQAFEHLQSLQSLQSHSGDYRDVPIPTGALIYCDIPYANTNCGKYQGFDHYSFYEWAEKQDNIFISEYSMPQKFIPIAKTEKTILSTNDGNNQKATEYIFTNQRTYDALPDKFKRMVEFNMAVQTNIFDFL